MDTLKKINDEYKKIIRRERLKLITEWDAEKVEIVEKMEIVNVYWEDENVDDESYFIDLRIEDEQAQYFSSDYAEDGFDIFMQREFIVFDKKECDEIARWWEELDLKEKIHLLYKEKVEKKLRFAEENHVNQKVIRVEKGGDRLVYFFDNGKELVVPVLKEGI